VDDALKTRGNIYLYVESSLLFAPPLSKFLATCLRAIEPFCVAGSNKRYDRGALYCRKGLSIVIERTWRAFILLSLNRHFRHWVNLLAFYHFLQLVSRNSGKGGLTSGLNWGPRMPNSGMARGQ